MANRVGSADDTLRHRDPGDANAHVVSQRKRRRPAREGREGAGQLAAAGRNRWRVARIDRRGRSREAVAVQGQRLSRVDGRRGRGRWAELRTNHGDDCVALCARRERSDAINDRYCQEVVKEASKKQVLLRSGKKKSEYEDFNSNLGRQKLHRCSSRHNSSSRRRL